METGQCREGEEAHTSVNRLAAIPAYHSITNGRSARGRETRHRGARIAIGATVATKRASACRISRRTDGIITLSWRKQTSGEGSSLGDPVYAILAGDINDMSNVAGEHGAPELGSTVLSNQDRQRDICSL